MRMKKTCDGCRALEPDIYRLWQCSLHYKIDVKQGVPLEPCPKPRTIKQLVHLPRKEQKI